MSHCVVFVCNRRFVQTFINTYNQLRQVGRYTGDVCLIVGDDLKDLVIEGVIVVYFPEITFPPETLHNMLKVKCDGRNITKRFQWHKLYVFNTYFKKWNYIFYLDCGVKIFGDINIFLTFFKPNTFLAHSDSYPTYKWVLAGQFDSSMSHFEQLSKDYNLERNYYQTTVMMFDTSLITENTVADMIRLAIKYPNTRTNEQAIVNLHFQEWEQLPLGDGSTFYYDFSNRTNTDKYLLIKYISHY